MPKWKHSKRLVVIASIVVVAVLSTLGFGIRQYVATKHTLEDTESKLQASLETITALEKQNEELGGSLTQTQTEKEKVAEALAKQKRQNEDLEEERDKYRKIAQTDKQLLAKYSKVYFLNENYSPVKLIDIEPKYLVSNTKTLQFLKPAYSYLEDLLDEAADDGLNLKIASAYRSFEEQTALKSTYKVIYGSGANTFSADQGYSEHQLGTTVDFTTPTLVGAVPGFANAKEYQWLLDNAYRFGFILSYPKSNSYYIYEPWHWRFVGIDLATDLHKQGKNFYDMDQREIDAYLIKIFD